MTASRRSPRPSSTRRLSRPPCASPRASSCAATSWSRALPRGPEAVLLECNARVGGASTLGFHAGVDSPALGDRARRVARRSSRALGGYRRSLRLVRYPADRLVERVIVAFDLDDTLYPEETFVRSGFRAVARALARALGRARRRRRSTSCGTRCERDGRGRQFDDVVAGARPGRRQSVRELVDVYRHHDARHRAAATSRARRSRRSARGRSTSSPTGTRSSSRTRSTRSASPRTCGTPTSPTATASTTASRRRACSS